MMMSTQEENYTGLAIDEGFQILTKPIGLSRKFTVKRKLQLARTMLDYYVELEDYGKCTKLRAIIEGLENSSQAN
jgi:protein-arginine kinase activator protein McsA